MDKQRILNDIQSEDIDVKTAAAADINELNIEQDVLMQYLAGDNYQLKNLALLKIKSITSKEEAAILFGCLVDNPSEIRELASFVVKKIFMDLNMRAFFQQECFLETLKRNMLDVNPMVCRTMLDVIFLYEYRENLLDYIIDTAQKLLEEIENTGQKRSHGFNKFLFSLYWSLFAIAILLRSNLRKEIPIEKIIKITRKSQQFKEYTIREKGAAILSSLIFLGDYLKWQDEIDILKNEFLNDSNFYVRAVLDTP